MSRAVDHGTSARVLAIEPCPAAFDTLERNLSAAPRATCARLALRERPGRATLHCYPDAPAESSCHPRERAQQRAALRSAGCELAPADARAVEVEVEAATLSAVLDAHGVSRVDLLKVDYSNPNPTFVTLTLS